MGPVDSPAGTVNPRDEVHVVIAPFTPLTLLNVVDTDPDSDRLLVRDPVGNFHIIRSIAVARVIPNKA